MNPILNLNLNLYMQKISKEKKTVYLKLAGWIQLPNKSLWYNDNLPGKLNLSNFYLIDDAYYIANNKHE